MPTTSLNELASTLSTTPERLRVVVKQALGRLPHRRYYVFRITGKQRPAGASSTEPRVIAAFPSPDDALAFAQRNGYGSNAQLRPVESVDLVIRMLSDDSIGAIFFAHDTHGAGGRGFGPGIKLNRAELLAELQGEAAPMVASEEHRPFAPEELTAETYDALQFGVNFTRRAEFRVALAQAVEEVVETYEPPTGSVDMGRRSIFATSAVEAWLKQHGFPRAHQRRWIDVADDPAWDGAVELCEIDAGTANRLLVQLAIHQDAHDRQYIRRVYVTA